MAEVLDLPVSVWTAESEGAASSFVAFIEDEPELAEIVVALWDVARSSPYPPELSVRSGRSGVAVVVTGFDFTVVARPGGPVLVLSDRIRGLLRVDLDPSWHDELTVLVSELIAVGQGAQPFDESVVPPPHRLPWHRDE